MYRCAPQKPETASRSQAFLRKTPSSLTTRSAWRSVTCLRGLVRRGCPTRSGSTKLKQHVNSMYTRVLGGCDVGASDLRSSWTLTVRTYPRSNIYYSTTYSGFCENSRAAMTSDTLHATVPPNSRGADRYLTVPACKAYLNHCSICWPS